MATARRWWRPTAPTTGVTSGIGDLRLGATYAIPMQGVWGVDLTGNVKIATADEDKGLGTGANDYGVAVDVYRNVGEVTSVFGGVGYTMLGDSDYIEVDSVFNGNVGFSRKFGNNSAGLVYDYRQPTSDDADDRSEITGFFSFPTSDTGKLQLYALTGLTNGSPEWGAGVSSPRASDTRACSARCGWQVERRPGAAVFMKAGHWPAQDSISRRQPSCPTSPAWRCCVRDRFGIGECGHRASTLASRSRCSVGKGERLV